VLREGGNGIVQVIGLMFVLCARALPYEAGILQGWSNVTAIH